MVGRGMTASMLGLIMLKLRWNDSEGMDYLGISRISVVLVKVLSSISRPLKSHIE